MTFIINVLLITMLILQIIVLIHMLITNIKREKADKKFWQEMNESLMKSVAKYNNLYPEEPLQLEEDKSEQTEDQK